MNQRQLHYLQAMGVEVWLPRGGPPVGNPAQSPAQPVEQGRQALPGVGLRLGPGNGSCLLVCAGPEQSATPLASDLARVLGATPVWAWPSEDPDSGALAQAVDDRLFTSVVVFGAGLAARVCGGEPPASCGSAQLLVGPDLEELLTQADARRQCWAVLRAGGLQLGK